MNKKSDVIVVGFALFAMFFGAGNLIFPPYLGVISGSGWPLAMGGFLITGIGLTLMGIVAIAISGTSINDMADRVHPKFGALLGSVIMIIIGPLFAIPRTAATTYEIAMVPTMPGFSNILFIIIFFAITLYFSIRPASVVDSIGKVLTPVLLIVLLIIIGKGIITPIGETITLTDAAGFSRGFTEGYQTMDALGSVILASIIIESVIAKGNCDRIGIDGHLSHKTADGRKVEEDCNFPTHAEAFERLVQALTTGDAAVISSMDEVSAVGHRVVQGAELFTKTTLVTDEVIDEIENLKELAPVHNHGHAPVVQDSQPAQSPCQNASQ